MSNRLPDDYPLPTPEELQKAWKKLQREWKNYLKVHGVKIPDADNYNEVAYALWLAVLYHFKAYEVHKDYIAKITDRDMSGLGRDQQIRHLKRDGWHIGHGKGVHRLDVTQPSSEFLKTSRTKGKLISAKDFTAIKKAYDFRCVTCGAKEGEANFRYGDEKIKLQRGHRDPNKSGEDRNNIIPQCQFCNRAYKGDYLFDKKGRVVGVNSVAPVKKAHPHVKKDIFEYLKKLFPLVLLFIIGRGE